MRKCLMLAALLLVACGQDVHEEIVAADTAGRAAQRAKLAPDELPGFDRYAKLSNIPHAVQTDQSDDVASAIRVGNELLRSDATVESAYLKQSGAKKVADYRQLAEHAREACLGIEGSLRKACIMRISTILSEGGVPAEYWPH